MNGPGKLIPVHGGYRKLKSFQVDAVVAVIAAEAAQVIAELIELVKEICESVGDNRPCWKRQKKPIE